MKAFYIFSLIFVIAACTLNGDQEKSLNEAMVSYIESRNNTLVKPYIDCIHPNALAYYKSKGDKAFMKKFNLNLEENSVYLHDGSVLATKSNEGNIHVKYEYVGVIETEYEIRGAQVFIYALSSDDGASWYFLDDIDYFNDQIIKPKSRLIKK